MPDRGLFTDARGDILRLGPAPYLDDRQLTGGIAAPGEIIGRARQGIFHVYWPQRHGGTAT